MILEMNKDTVTLEKACPFCGQLSTATVPTIGFDKYMNGELVQRAFPNIPAETREFMITGMCKDCQEEIFGQGVLK